MSFTSAESRWRDVYLVSGLRAVSVCGDFLAATALSLILQQRGQGGLAVAALLIAASLPVAVLGPWVGRLVDRADSRLLLVVCGLAQAVVCAGLAFATHPALIIGLVALLACGLAVTQPTLAALVPAMVRPADLPKASGLSQTASSVGMLAGPALAGVLVGEVGGQLPLLLDAASYLALVGAGFLIRTRRRGGSAATSAAAGKPWRLREDRLLRTMLGVLVAVIGSVSAVNVVEVFFVRDALGGSATMFGLVAAAWTVGLLIGTAIFARVPNRWMTVPAVVGLMAATCLPVLAGATVSSSRWLLPLWLVGGVSNGGVSVLIAVVVANRVPAEARGRAFAMVNAAVQGASMLGFLVAGPFVDRFDSRLLLAVAGVAGVASALLCFPVAIRRQTADARRPVPARVEPAAPGGAEPPASAGVGRPARSGAPRRATTGVRPEPPCHPVPSGIERVGDSVEA